MANLFLSEVLDVSVYDEKGVFITTLDKVLSGELIYNTSRTPILLLNIANFDLNFVKAIGEEVRTEFKSDFDKDISNNKSTVIVFKDLSNYHNVKYFKLIARANLRDSNGDEVLGIKIIVDNATLISGLDLEFKYDSVSEFTHAFELNPNEMNDAFTLEIIENAQTKKSDEDVLVDLLIKSTKSK